MDDVLAEIKKAQKVYCFGVGREGFTLKSWVIRLQQLNVQVRRRPLLASLFCLALPDARRLLSPASGEGTGSSSS